MNKRILITGGGGFLSESLRLLFLQNGYNVCCPYRKDLDVCNLDQLKKYLENYNFDYVIHCAIKGGRLLKEEDPWNLCQNILMQENLLRLSHLTKKIVLFNSGAQENRTKDINNLKEGEFFDPPKNLYSLSKYVNAKRALNNDKVIALRIFNCFGPLEKQDRLISTMVRNYINKQEIELWGDSYFDFFGINDLFIVLNHILQNPPNKYFELNLVYPEKLKLSQIANIVNSLDNYKVNVKITDGVNRNYFGSGFKLQEMNLKLNGLEKEIFLMYKELKK